MKFLHAQERGQLRSGSMVSPGESVNDPGLLMTMLDEINQELETRLGPYDGPLEIGVNE